MSCNIEKIQRRIDILVQKLEHIDKEIANIIKKSRIKPLRKRTSWHLDKLVKVKKFYNSEISRLNTVKLDLEMNEVKVDASEL